MVEGKNLFFREENTSACSGSSQWLDQTIVTLWTDATPGESGFFLDLGPEKPGKRAGKAEPRSSFHPTKVQFRSTRLKAVPGPPKGKASDDELLELENRERLLE